LEVILKKTKKGRASKQRGSNIDYPIIKHNNNNPRAECEKKKLVSPPGVKQPRGVPTGRKSKKVKLPPPGEGVTIVPLQNIPIRDTSNYGTPFLCQNSIKEPVEEATKKRAVPAGLQKGGLGGTGKRFREPMKVTKKEKGANVRQNRKRGP